MDFKNLYDDFEIIEIPSSNHGKPMTCGTYVIEHSDGLYVGSSEDLYRRKNGHKSLLGRNTHFNKEFQEAYNRDPNYQMRFLVTETREEAYAVEQHLIDEMMPYGVLFNRSPDAKLANKGLTHTASEETRQKLRDAHVGRIYPEKTEEHCKNISLAKTGKPLSDYHRQRIAEGSPRRVGVCIEGVEYPSMGKAAEALGLNSGTVWKRVRSEDPEFSEWKSAGQPS